MSDDAAPGRTHKVTLADVAKVTPATRRDDWATGEPPGNPPQAADRATGGETRANDNTDNNAAQIRAAVADMEANDRRADRMCAAGSAMPATPSPQGYTAAQFAQDIAPLLLTALPEFRRHGLMKTCAHCGKTLDGVTFVLRTPDVQHGNPVAHILSICNACATRPADLSPSDWPHARDDSGLLLQQCEWAQFTRFLRRHAMTLLHGGFIFKATDRP
jgi:hypothetical protein